MKKTLVDKLTEQKEPLAKASEDLSSAQVVREGLTNSVNQYRILMEEKFYWTDLIQTLHGIFSTVEANSGQGPGFEQGIWIEEFKPLVPGVAPRTVVRGTPRPGVPPASTPAATAGINAGKIDKIFLKCRAVNLNRSSPTANSTFAFKLEAELQTNAVFVAKGTKLGQLDAVDEKDLTFTFGMTLQLAKPIKLN